MKGVSDGYARNFLIPRHLALPATISILEKVQKEERERQAKIQKLQEHFNALKNQLDKTTFVIKAKADKQNLFAAIHENEIAKVINNKLNLDLNPEQIKLFGPIKSLGLHELEIQFAQNSSTKVKLDVQAI